MLVHVQCMYTCSLVSADELSSSIDGRYAHTAVVANDNLLVVSGGFRGNVLNDMLALNAPPSMGVNVSVFMLCSHTCSLQHVHHVQLCTIRYTS